jgi:hypothetical protein
MHFFLVIVLLSVLLSVSRQGSVYLFLSQFQAFAIKRKNMNGFCMFFCRAYGIVTEKND